MINYIVVNTELDVAVYIPYEYYNDVLRYYNISNALHRHECVKDHYKLLII